MCLFRAKKAEHPQFREKEESLRKSFTDQVKDEETRFRQWEQQVTTRQEKTVN
jgi:cell division control protein 12